jgi:hypothetical protein
MGTLTWHLLDICSGTGDDNVRVYAIELDADDTAIELRSASLVSECDREWARAHLCLDYLLAVGSRNDRMLLDGLGLSLFQGHLHASSPSDTLDVRPVCVWLDERARRRYEPTVGNTHAPLLFEALRTLPFAASPQELVALACAARQCMRPPRSARGLPEMLMPSGLRRAKRRVVATALVQCVLGALFLLGGSPPAALPFTMSNPIPYVSVASSDVASSASNVVIRPAQPSRSPAQIEPTHFAVLRVEEPEEPE